MAVTQKGVWDLQDVRDKQLESEWPFNREGLMFGWGNNSIAGTIGVNDVIQRSSPTQIPGTTWGVAATTGYHHASVVKTDGTLWAWGQNAYGTVADNTTDNISSPMQVGTGTDWSKSDSGHTFQAALKTDGSLWFWGGNTWGTLGQNGPSTNHKSSPVQLPGKTWSYFNCDGNTVLAVDTNGELWTWGKNDSGMLGQGFAPANVQGRSSPTQVGTDTTWSGIGEGTVESRLATKTDGTLWQWGLSDWGEGGRNNRTRRSSPTQVGTDTTWQTSGTGTMSGSYHHYSAIKTNGTLWHWGNNDYGQLGLNTQGDNRSSPTQVGTDTNWSKTASTGQSTCALKTDGTLWGWGYNNKGQQGGNDTVNRSSPTQIAGTWDDVKSGDQVMGGPYFAIVNE